MFTALFNMYLMFLFVSMNVKRNIDEQNFYLLFYEFDI